VLRETTSRGLCGRRFLVVYYRIVWSFITELHKFPFKLARSPRSYHYISNIQISGTCTIAAVVKFPRAE
jgi:hypothetical protein